MFRVNKTRLIKGLICCMVALGLMSLMPASVLAKATGQCAKCHTMHNSQDGGAFYWSGDASGVGATTLNRALVRWDCIGCHTGTNPDANIPYVLSTSEPTYTGAGTTGDTLAGGNFYWVADAGGDTDNTGHNVIGLASQDAAIGLTPPGFVTGFLPNGESDQQVAPSGWTQQLTCAGTYGCHGTHDTDDDFGAISGAHHGNDASIDGSTVAKSFRFLYGIRGIEDSDWEYQPTSTEHNQYMGVDKTSDAIPTGGSATQTISFLCAECHGNFHSGSGNAGADNEDTVGSPWIRHPTDYDMNNVASKEYGAYPGDSSGTYDVVAPVASDLDSVSGIQSTVLDQADDAIVTCISCHRAHGTPNADLLRWDYGTCDAGTDDSACGCFKCHTTKDAG